jgi:hypothetical protein
MREFFFPEFNIKLYDKYSESDSVKLIADTSGFLNYLPPGGVVMVDKGFTTYVLSSHRHVILYIHGFMNKINFNLLLRCSNN